MSDLERIIRVAASQQRQIELLRTLLASLNPPERVTEQLATLDAIQALAGEHIAESDLVGGLSRPSLEFLPRGARPLLWSRITASGEHLIVTCIETALLNLNVRHQNTIIANGSSCIRMFLWVKPHETLEVVGANLTDTPVRVPWPPRITGFRLLG